MVDNFLAKSVVQCNNDRDRWRLKAFLHGGEGVSRLTGNSQIYKMTDFVCGGTCIFPQRAKSRCHMFRAIQLQLGATLITATLAGLIFGMHGAVSAALGGAACTLPNWLFAMRLSAASRKPGASYPATFFVGAAVKVASTIALLAVVMALYRDIHWVALFVGLVVALKAPLFAFLFKF